MFLLLLFQNHLFAFSPPDSSFQYEVEKVLELDATTFSTLNIFSNRYNGKGFLNKEDGPACDCREKADSIANTRMKLYVEIEHWRDDLFFIRYRYREGPFILDTFRIYTVSGLCVALSDRYFSRNENHDAFVNWYLMPASTDERDVVFMCHEGNRRYRFYQD